MCGPEFIKTLFGIIEKFKSNNSPLLIVNGVKLYYLDQLLGEVPMKRVGLVRWIRKIVKFELTRSQFKTA